MKKEKVIIISTFILLTFFSVILLLFWDKIQKNNYNEVEYLDNLNEEINSFALKPDMYMYQEEISKILSQKQFSEYELDIYFSDQNKYDWFIYPDKNVYCIDVWWSKQHFIDYKLYTFFKNGTFRKNAPYYAWAYMSLAEDYLDGNKISGSSDFYKMLVQLNQNNEKLLNLYNINDSIAFKKEILKLNNSNGNHDALTILFFSKNNLPKDSIEAYLNQCFDYKNEWLFNEDNVKPILYKYLLKAE